MCRLAECTYCKPDNPHVCRTCNAVDMHFTRDCLVTKIFNLSRQQSSEPPSEKEAWDIAIQWENEGHSFWFEKGDIGYHFEYFRDIQKSNYRDYGDTLRFANNNVELLMCSRWRVFVYALLKRLHRPLPSACKDGDKCAYNRNGLCWYLH